jgi:predicted metallopeptidase
VNMGIKYYKDQELERKVIDIANRLGMKHDMKRITCIRSYGSSSKRVLARCHALPRVMQLALDVKPHYVIEIISENFDKLSEEEKTKTLIHELMHIPKSFGGGFKFHNVVNKKSVDEMYKKYINNSNIKF